MFARRGTAFGTAELILPGTVRVPAEDPLPSSETRRTLQVKCCASRLSTHQRPCARFRNSQDQQARYCCSAGVEGPTRMIVVRDGEHGGVGDLAENLRGQVPPKYPAVLAGLHEVGKGLIDWSHQCV